MDFSSLVSTNHYKTVLHTNEDKLKLFHPESFSHLHQSQVNLKNLPPYNEHPTSKQNAEIDSLISGDFAFVAIFYSICCNEDTMIHYNNINSVHYWAINAQNFENNRI